MLPNVALRPHRSLLARAALAAVTLALAVSTAACTATATPVPDPSSPCGGADVQRGAGFYPDLEKLVPPTLAGATPTVRDSGRYCSTKTLGPLATRHDEVRFAGATFPRTSQSGISLIVYNAPGLTADEVGDAFRAGSGTGRQTELVSDAPRQVGGRTGRRIELINGNTRQVVVVWPSRTPGDVLIVIVVDVSNAAIDDAVAAFDGFGAGRGSPPAAPSGGYHAGASPARAV